MAKKTTPKPQAIAAAQVLAPEAHATLTETKIEGVTAIAEGNPMPPTMGNEGTAAGAGEGQSSPADTAEATIILVDGVTPTDAILDALEVVAEGVIPIFPDASDATKITLISSPLQTEPASLGGAPSLIVTGPKKGRWRIGRKFGPEPVTLLAADLSEDDLKALGDDKTLTVTAVAAPY